MAPWASRNSACTSKHYELIKVYLPLKKKRSNRTLQKDYPSPTNRAKITLPAKESDGTMEK
jgi:hypothetical protein